MKEEQVRVCEMIKHTVVQLCETSFASDNIQIRGVIGVTINDSDVLVIHINEDVTEFGETSCQSLDKTAAESSAFKLYSNVLNESSSASAAHSFSLFPVTSMMSQVFPVAMSVEHQTESNRDDLLQDFTHNQGYSENEESQDEQCHSEALVNINSIKEEHESMDEMFNPNYNDEIAAPEISRLHLRSVVSRAVLSQHCNNDSVLETVKQEESGQAEFFQYDNIYDHNPLSTGNCILSDSGCQASNFSNVAFETQSPLRRIFGGSSRRTVSRGALSRSMPHTSRTNFADLHSKVSESLEVGELLMTDNHAMEHGAASVKTSMLDVGCDRIDKVPHSSGEKPLGFAPRTMRFTHSGSLGKRCNTYSGEKPFACRHCSKSFKQSSVLKTHLLTHHTGEKPFVCTQCNMTFSRSENLGRHIRSHSGEKPFACMSCSKRFTQSGNLKRHLRNQTCEKPYTHTRERFTLSDQLQPPLQ